MPNVNKWIKEYEKLVILEDEQDEDYMKSTEMQERLKTMRFQLTAKLWGTKLT